MLDMKLIRENPEQVKRRLAARGSGEEASIGEIAALDEQRRKLVTESDALKAQRNQVSKEIGQRKAKGEALDPRLSTLSSGIGDRITALDSQLAALDAQLQSILLMIPNLPHE